MPQPVFVDSCRWTCDRPKSVLAAGLFSLALAVSACGSSDEDTTNASSVASTHHSASASITPEDETTPENGDQTTPQRQATKPPLQPEQDDDPGGHPCIDQSGAPGHLVPETTTGGQWICEITGDAPRN